MTRIVVRQPFGEGAVVVDGVPLDLAESLIYRGHSPDGFSWGYGGSGPAQTALGILLRVVGADLALRHYMDFKAEHVSKWPVNDHDLELDVAGWVARREAGA